MSSVICVRMFDKRDVCAFSWDSRFWVCDETSASGTAFGFAAVDGAADAVARLGRASLRNDAGSNEGKRKGWRKGSDTCEDLGAAIVV